MDTVADPALAQTRRWAAIRRTASATVVARAFSVACTLAQVPVAVRYLGEDAYGFWIVLLGLAGFINFVDFGLGVGLQRGMAAAFGRDDPTSIQRWYRAGVICLGGLGLAIVAFTLPWIWLMDWSAVFRLSDPLLAAQATPALACVIALFALGLPFNATARLAASVQLGHLHALWIATGSFLALLAVWVVAKADLGFLWFVVLGSAAPLAQGVGLHLHIQRRRRASLLMSADGLSRDERRELWRDSLGYAPAQAGQAIVQMLPPLALAVAAGPAMAATFGVLQRLFNPLQQAQLVLLTPLWPAYTEAAVRGDRSWVRRAFRMSAAATAAVVLALAALAALAPMIVARWIGPEAPSLPPQILWGVTAWFGAQLALQPLLYLLMGLGERRTLTWPGSATAIAAVGLLFVGGVWWEPALALLLGAGVQLLALPAFVHTARRLTEIAP